MSAPGASTGAKFDEDAMVQTDAGEGVFLVQVTQDGKIFHDGVEISEEDFSREAALRIIENPDVKAILLVGSSQIQGIHLTSLLAEVGFKNVTVYYPTATVPK